MITEVPTDSLLAVTAVQARPIRLMGAALPICLGIDALLSRGYFRAAPDGSDAATALRCVRTYARLLRRRGQEQNQIITNVIGKPTPKAPPIVNANAESKLSS